MENFEIIFLVVALIVTLISGFKSFIKLPYGIMYFLLVLIISLPKIFKQAKEIKELNNLKMSTLSSENKEVKSLMDCYLDVCKQLELHNSLKYLFSLTIWGLLTYLLYF